MSHRTNRWIFALLCLFALILGHASKGLAADSANEAEQVNVDAIKQKYWARGDDSELGVVQNRLYSKTHKIEFGFFGGTTSTDPFLSVHTLGGSAGYHFSEYLAADIVGWKSFVSPSSALQTFQDNLGASTNNNPPRYFLGAEGRASFLYGKLSLAGKSIIYYDLHFLGGLGMTGTDNGTYATPFVGLGQQIYLSRSVSLCIDYRLMYYHETLVEKVNPAKLGENRGSRGNFSNSINLGVNYLFGGASPAEDKK